MSNLCCKNYSMYLNACCRNVLVVWCTAGLKVARSRARFFRGDRDLLLYTGRAHFFNRYCIRGIHHLIFYSLPECPQFYPEMVNLLEVRWRHLTLLDLVFYFLFVLEV